MGQSSSSRVGLAAMLLSTAGRVSVVAGMSAGNLSTIPTVSGLLSNGDINLGIVEDAYQKAKAFVAQLDNQQKVSIITGKQIIATNGTKVWTPLVSGDGIAGVNFKLFVSGFPVPTAVSMTWNRTLSQEHFTALGEEFYDLGYNLVGGPVGSPNGRVILGGRQPEVFSPEPYLTGTHMSDAVSALNGAGIATVARHFLFYEQETNRTSNPSYSSNADDKTTREIYAWPFADGIKAGLVGVMCSMNRVNESYSCENSRLLNDHLKTNLGFPGVVTPDALSQKTSFESANAGLDYGSSQFWSYPIIEAGIQNGSLSQARLDDMAIRNVIPYYFVGLNDGKQPSPPAPTSQDDTKDVRRDHWKVIRQVGVESITLLKNNNKDGLGLPLQNPKTISLFGAHAGPVMAGPNRPFSLSGFGSSVYQGHLAYSQGSPQASLPYLVTPFQAISARAIADRSMIWWIMNDTYTYPSTIGGFPSSGGGFPGSGGSRGGTQSETSAIAEPGVSFGATAVTPSFKNYAANSDVCLAFINADCGEGTDRGEYRNTDQDKMIITVANNCKNTVVVVNACGPRLIGSWVEHENITAVLYGSVLGQESGNAITDLLYGDAVPSGKLVYSIPDKFDDIPSQFRICQTLQCAYDEGVFIDYRYYDAKNISVRFPFGFGMSYTIFEYDEVNLKVVNTTSLSYKYAKGALGLGGAEDLWDQVLTVTTTVKNTGTIAGAEVAQLYVSFPAEAAQPPRVLRGFAKLQLAPNETAMATFPLRRRDLSYWDTVAQKWAMASGDYNLTVGASSRDLRSSTTLKI